MWELLVGFVTIFSLWYFLKGSKSNYWTDRGFVSLSELSFFELLTGSKSTSSLDLENYAALGSQKFGGIMEFGNPLLYIKDLDLARDIFIKDFDHFHDHREISNAEPLFQDSLFTMKGQAWKNMRAFLSPTFTSGRIKRMFPHFQRTSVALKAYIEAAAGSVPAAEAMRKFALDVIGSAVFGLDINVFQNSDQTLYKMAEKLFGETTLGKRIKMVAFQNFPRLSALIGISIIDREVSQYFQNMLSASLAAREKGFAAGGGKSDDFMSLLVEARHGHLAPEHGAELEMKSGNKNDIQWTDMLMINQAFTFMSAGFDAVSNNLTIAAYILAKYPEMQEKVYQEIYDLGEINYEAVNKMEYLDMFLAEILRLYPAVNRLDRKCVKDYPIPGTKLVIPKGTILAFVAEGIHRDERHFPNPMEFRPQRFSQEEKAKRHSYAYMPFGLGNRSCIGNRFAVVESKAGLAHVVKDFEISLPAEMEGDAWVVSDLFGYKTKPGLRLQFKPRN